MEITVTLIKDDEFINVKCTKETTLDNFWNLCQTSMKVPKSTFLLMHDGKIMLTSATKTLEQENVKDGDLMIVIKNETDENPSTVNNFVPKIDFSNIVLPKSTSKNDKHVHSQLIQNLKNHFLKNPQELEILRQRNPDLVDAFLKNDVKKFCSIMQPYMSQSTPSSSNLGAGFVSEEDLMKPEIQEKIYSYIHQKNIDNAMEAALEHTPESFAMVHMLYINIRVNGIPLKAFVDTGAQSTLMSKSCAQKCNLLRLADKRWSGIARGVGVQNILGRIHMTHVIIEHAHIPCSFSILEGQMMDVLLGLDVLLRHHCIIDLEQNVLHIKSHGVSTPFLPENEIPKYHHEEELGGPQNYLEHSTSMPAFDAKNVQTNKESAPHGDTNDAINQLVEMGFPRQTAEKELEKCGGNVELAAINLSRLFNEHA